MTTTEKLLLLKDDFDDVYSAGYEKGKAEGGVPVPERIVLAKAFTNCNSAYNIFSALCAETERGALFTLDTSNMETIPNNQCLEFLFLRDNLHLSGYHRQNSSTPSTGLSSPYFSNSYDLIGKIGDVFIKEVLL